MINGVDLFSGIGGISLALAPYVRTVAYCEMDERCQQVLLSRMLDNGLDSGPVWDDVNTVTIPPAVDFIAAGWPCQGNSLNGNRERLNDPRSGLIYKVAELADNQQIKGVFLENVKAVQSDEPTIKSLFTSMGYEFVSTTNDVYSVGGCHSRERWFALAYRPGFRIQRVRAFGEQEPQSLGQSLLPYCGRDGQWKVEPDLRVADDGVSAHMAWLKPIGNAVVPLQARKAFELLTKLTERTAPP